MPTEHIVQQGETVARIASQYGFADWRTIWENGANASLASLRRNPDVLAARDVIVIPDKVQRVVSATTGQHHVFRLRSFPVKLRLVLRDFDNEPLRNTKVTLSVEGQDFDLETDDDGLLEAEIPETAEQGEIRFKDPLAPFDLTIPLEIGHLDPVATVSGQISRLNNLGYSAGTGGGEDATHFEMAVQEFQVDHGLAVDGVCGPETQAKLEELYGS
jgi:hypothetical protein